MMFAVERATWEEVGNFNLEKSFAVRNTLHMTIVALFNARILADAFVNAMGNGYESIGEVRIDHQE